MVGQVAEAIGLQLLAQTGRVLLPTLTCAQPGLSEALQCFGCVEIVVEQVQPLESVVGFRCVRMLARQAVRMQAGQRQIS